MSKNRLILFTLLLAPLWSVGADQDLSSVKPYAFPKSLLDPDSAVSPEVRQLLAPPTVPSFEEYKRLNEELKRGPFPLLDKRGSSAIVQPDALVRDGSTEFPQDPMAAGPKTPVKRPLKKDKDGKVCPPTMISTLEDALEGAYFFGVELESQRVGVKLLVEEMSRSIAEWRPSLYVKGSQHLDKSDTRSRVTAPIFPRVGDDLPIRNRERSANASASLYLTQNLYAGGGTMARIDKSQEKFRSGLFQLIAQEQQTFAKVVNAYVDAVIAEETLTMEKKNEFYLTEILHQTEMHYAVGDQTVADVSIAKAKLSGAVLQVASAEAQVKAKRAALYALINVPLAPNLSMPDFYQKLPKTVEALKQVSLKYYPPLLAAIHNQKAARFEVGSVTARLLPSVDVTASYGPSHIFRMNKRSPSFLRTGETSNRRGGSVDVSVSIPIYEKGVTQSQYRSAEQEVKQAKLQVELQRRQVLEQCTAYFASFEAAKINVAAAKIALEANKVSLEAARTEFSLGMKNFLQVMQIEEHWLQSYRDYIRSMSELIKNSYSVLQMTGKLLACNLNLHVESYDPSVYYERYVDSLWSLGEDEEVKNPFEPYNRSIKK